MDERPAGLFRAIMNTLNPARRNPNSTTSASWNMYCISVAYSLSTILSKLLLLRPLYIEYALVLPCRGLALSHSVQSRILSWHPATGSLIFSSEDNGSSFLPFAFPNKTLCIIFGPCRCRPILFQALWFIYINGLPNICVSWRLYSNPNQLSNRHVEIRRQY